jgi:hypothetical protein
MDFGFESYVRHVCMSLLFLCLFLPVLVEVLKFAGPSRKEPINKNAKPTEVNSRVEAGSNTSTVALRVVGGHKKGSLESVTVKYGRESDGTRTW